MILVSIIKYFCLFLTSKDYFETCEVRNGKLTKCQLDVDGDMRGDLCDNCPTLPNYNQADVKQESVNVEILGALVHIMEYNPMVTIGGITSRGMFGVMHQQALVCATIQVQMNKPPVLMKISFVPKRDASVPNLIKDMS